MLDPEMLMSSTARAVTAAGTPAAVRRQPGNVRGRYATVTWVGGPVGDLRGDGTTLADGALVQVAVHVPDGQESALKAVLEALDGVPNDLGLVGRVDGAVPTPEPDAAADLIRWAVTVRYSASRQGAAL